MPDLGASGRRLARWPSILRALAGGAAVVLTLVLLARWFLFSGPYRPPEPLPEERIVDLHVHTAGIGAGDSGCRISSALRDSYKFGIYLSAFGVTREELEKEGDALLIARLSESVRASRQVGAVVVLALDGAVDQSGELDLARTEIFEFLLVMVPLKIRGGTASPLRPLAVV